MTKQALNKIEKLINELNKKNEKFLNSYTLKATQYKRGSYAGSIEYSQFFSTDFERLMDIVKTDNLILWLGTYTENLAHIEIQ